MAAPFGQFNTAEIESTVQNALTAMRDALAHVQQIQVWLSAHAQSDFTAAPLSMPAADVAAIFSAVADASAVAQIFQTGLPPGTYPQPSSAYVYENSAYAVIGPDA